MSATVGTSLDRVDGPAKVSGTARYAAEFEIPRLAHAALLTSPIPRGRIARVGTRAAEDAPGVIAVLSHENAMRLPYKPMEERPPVDPKEGEQLRVLQGPEILFAGQPVALVVAETPEQARHAADLIVLECEVEEAQTRLLSEDSEAPGEGNAEAGRPEETSRGDAESAFSAAEVRVDARYVQPREHHNAIEPHATIAHWEGERLTLHDKTQWVGNDRNEIAHVFGIDPDHVRVISPFVGGAFGSGLRTWPHVALAAMAARQAGRPVRLELSRRELYASIGFRPETRQRVRLAAGSGGKLAAIIHEAVGQTSTYERYAETTLSPARNSYSCPNVLTRYRLAPMNVNTPGPMRAPGIVTGSNALEAAMNELAEALGMDPVELRIVNYAETDEGKGLPWSSNNLMDCYRTGAERFGWDRRQKEPGSLREGDELVGCGMATAIYHAARSPASASATLFANGTALVRTATSDMGPGTYTAMTQIAADALGLPPERVSFELGDTQLPSAPVHGGSITAASVGNAVLAACEALGAKLRRATLAGKDGPLTGASAEELVLRSGGVARRNGISGLVPFAEVLKLAGVDSLTADGSAAPGEEQEKYSSSAFGAVFAEARVDTELGVVRVPRIVGAYDVGRVINPKIARSQCIGGMVGGLGMALFEEAEWDPRLGRVMNANLAEYLVPVCADVDQLEVHFVPGEDEIFNPLGVKGLAELGICGVAPAIVAAVHNATGRWIRTLPITPEKLLA